MDGIIIINKTKGCTSHDIVYKIKKMLNKKVGHTGTLDPMAEGVLPILIGKGTQLSKYLINHDKKYIVELQLGIKTDTADSEGKIIEEKTVNKTKLSKENITNVLQTFIGKQEQIPPIYSAIKVNGKKLYEYARKGQEVELKPRQIEIYDIKLIDYSMDEKQIKFEVFCGKGTYIRSLCEDIATKFETVGYMKSLKRTQVGNFKIDNSITIEELKNLIENNENIDIDDILKNKIITVEEIFEKFKSINLDEKKLEMFLNGVMLTQNLDEGVYKIYNKNSEFIGTGTIKNKLLKRDIIL
ncbi:MAG: tRNA pseudouridine(55) synthase TruB [Clostridia bacterium]